MALLGLEYWLSHRLLRNSTNQSVRPIVTLSVIGISLCLLIVILAISITSGYKHTIEKKVIDMGSHIRISNYDFNYTYDPQPISKQQLFLKDLSQNPDIEHWQYFSTKSCILKTENQVEGIVLKGIDSTFSWKLFKDNLMEGDTIDLTSTRPSNGILLSASLCQKLQLHLKDPIYVYFVQDPPRQRKFVVEGIFETGLPEYDEKFVIGDLRHLQKLCGWDSNQVGGIELLLKDIDKMDEVESYVNDRIDYRFKAETIRQIYPHIFQWIDLFDVNVKVLLGITIFICVITLISTFFIIILEQTSTIGILKAIGMSNIRVRNVFFFVGLRIIFLGMLLGNILGISLCLLQKYLHIVKLDAASYYVSYVPIQLDICPLILLNVEVLLLCMIVLLLPATFVSKRITPVSAIKFE